METEKEGVMESPLPPVVDIDSTTQKRVEDKLRQTKLQLGSSSTPNSGDKSDSEDLLSLSMDEDGDGEYTPKPKKRKRFATPAAKKSTSKTPVMAGKSKQTPGARQRKSKVPEFTTGMRALSVDQLVGLIERVVEKHPATKMDFILLAPLPDLSPLENNLEKLKKAVYKAFPWTKWGSDRDAFCFRRVQTHLDTFQRECIAQCKRLIDFQQWKSSMEYILIAWKYVGELPNWDDPSNNKHKDQAYKKLSTHLTKALKQGTFEKEELEGYIMKFQKLTGNGMPECINLAGTILDKLN